jgi:hypothetical protein
MLGLVPADRADGQARTARVAPPAPDWEGLARGLLTETNLLRRDPAGYARHLDAMLGRFDGPLLERPGRRFLRTEEGAAAVREAIVALRRTRPMAALRWSSGLARAARDHVRDQGPAGGLEHRGSDGSRPAQRMGRHGAWRGGVGENIAFGVNSARDVIVQLLVDDGVPERGHRAALLDPGWGYAGAACGAHREYEQMCVMDFAVAYSER